MTRGTRRFFYTGVGAGLLVEWKALVPDHIARAFQRYNGEIDRLVFYVNTHGA